MPDQPTPQIHVPAFVTDTGSYHPPGPMPPAPPELDESTAVRLTLPQLWAMVCAIVAGAVAVTGFFVSLKYDMGDMKKGQEQAAVTMEAVRLEIAGVRDKATAETHLIRSEVVKGDEAIQRQVDGAWTKENQANYMFKLSRQNPTLVIPDPQEVTR